MQNNQNAVLARPDTLLGVCEAIGQDFGFNPLFLRVAFALPLLWKPEMAVAAYLVVGVIVAVSRFLFPNPRTQIAVEAPIAKLHEAEPVAPAAATRGQVLQAEELAVAA